MPRLSARVPWGTFRRGNRKQKKLSGARRRRRPNARLHVLQRATKHIAIPQLVCALRRFACGLQRPADRPLARRVRTLLRTFVDFEGEEGARVVLVWRLRPDLCGNFVCSKWNSAMRYLYPFRIYHLLMLPLPTEDHREFSSLNNDCDWYIQKNWIGTIDLLCMYSYTRIVHMHYSISVKKPSTNQRIVIRSVHFSRDLIKNHTITPFDYCFHFEIL